MVVHDMCVLNIRQTAIIIINVSRSCTRLSRGLQFVQFISMLFLYTSGIKVPIVTTNNSVKN